MGNDILVKVGADITNFSRAMAKTNKSLAEFGRANQQTFDAFKKVGAFAAGTGLAIAGGLGYAVKVTADFEKGMSRVGALSGATGKELELLTATARQLGRDTAFSASEAADGMAELALAGFKTNEIVDAMPGLLDMAAAGQVDLSTASAITANTLNAFGLEAAESTRVADVLAATFTGSATDLEGLGETMKYVAPVSKAMGISLEETAAAAAILGDAGIDGSMAGTALAQAMTLLSSPSKQAADTMKDLGFSAFDANGEMKPLNQIITELTESTAHLSDEQRMNAINTLFGARAGKAMLTLMDKGGDTIADFTKELENSGGTAKRIAEEQLDNLHGQLTILKSGFDEAAISIGTALIPAIKLVTSFVQRLTNWFNSLSERTKSFIAIGAALTSVFMILAGSFLMFIGMFPTFVAGFSAIKTVAGVVATALAGISWPVTLVVAALVGAAALIIKYWTPIKGFFVGLWKSISKAFVDGFNAIDKATHGWLRNGIAVYKAWFKTGIDIFKRFWQYTKDTFSNALDFLKALVTLDFAGMKDAAVNQFDMLKDYLGDVWQIITRNMAKPLADLGKSVRRTFSDLYDWLNDKTNGFFGRFIDVVTAYYKTLAGVFKAGWSYIKDTFSNALKFLHGLVTLDFGKMGEAMRDQMENSKRFISEAWTAIRENIGKKLAEIAKEIKAKLPEWRDAIIDWAKEIPGKIVAKMSEWGSAIGNKLSEIGVIFIDKVAEWRDSVVNWFEELPGVIVDKVEGWRTALEDKLTGIGETFTDKMQEWRDKIGEWYDNMPEMIVEKLEGWRDAMVEWTEKQNEENIRQFGEWRDSIREWFESIPALMGDWLNEWKTKIIDWYGETKSSILEQLGEWKTAILDWFKKRPGEIYAELKTWWTKMGQWYDEAKSNIKGKLDDWWSTIKDWFVGLPNKPEIKNAGKKMVDKVSEGNNEKRGEFIDKLGKLIIDVASAALAMAVVALIAAGRELIRRLIDGMSGMAGSLRGKASELIQGVINTIRSISLWGIGRDLIRGLINGVGSMAGSLWAKARSLATGIASSIAGALKIKSPSKVAYDLAKWVPIGMADALTDYAKYVDKASDELAYAATPEIDMSYSTPSGIRSSLSSAVSGTVDVNSRDDRLIGALASIERRLGDLEVVMDGEQVGRIVRPHVNEGNARDAVTRRYFD